MQIRWADGHTSEYTFPKLRSACPCAHCDASRETVNAAEDLGLEDVTEVGHYAIRFFWSDGHDTGIYSYEYLRGLCACPTCVPST